MSLKSGKHTCIVTAPFNGWFRTSSKGTEGICLPLEITAGPCKGEEVEHIMWLSDGALPRTVKALVDAFGWDRNLAALAGLVNTGPFVGKECQITVEDELYNGKMYPKIQWLNRKGGGDGAPMAKESIAAMVARLSGKVLAVEVEGDAPKAAPKFELSPEEQALAPDEIPFLFPFITGLGTLLSMTC